MSARPVFPEYPGERQILFYASLSAFLIEATLLTLLGWSGHWLAHPQKTLEETGQFLDAQIFAIPPEAHLVEKTPPVAHAKPEATLSKVAHQGREAKPEEKNLANENQTNNGAEAAPSHGPVAIFSPAPQIPSYLQDKDLHASVVIDFLVTSNGSATPRLVGSSGNEELDAIALATVKKWQFRPAEKDHQAIDAKVRLRIVFAVE